MVFLFSQLSLGITNLAKCPVLHLKIPQVEKRTSSSEFLKTPVKKTAVAQIPLPASQSAQVSREPITAVDKTPQDGYKSIKSSESEPRGTKNKSVPLFVHNL